MDNLVSPLVSVILPTYNRAHILLESVLSVLNQDFSNLELIIIDDGSTDNTFELVNSIFDSRIKYIRFEKNAGVYAARNEGLKCIKGKLVAFADSDDIWLPGKLTEQVVLFNKYPRLELIFTDYLNFNHISNTEETGFSQSSFSLSQLNISYIETGVCEIVSGVSQAILLGNFIATPTVMFRSSILEKIGVFMENLLQGEDFEFWWRATVFGVRFAYIEHILLNRHKNADSLTAQIHKSASNFLKVLELCERTARDVGRIDLIPHLDRARSRTWISIIHACALEGNRREAWTAFTHSLNYGFSGRALFYFAAALAGPKAILVAKRVGR